jgi:hypothetical protein
MGLDRPEAAIERVKQGEKTACEYCRFSITQQVGRVLGASDDNVKAVYICDYDATAEDRCFGETVQSSPIHMIVWADRKTGALTSLISALDRTLAQEYAHVTGSVHAEYLLDVQVVDDSDVEKRAGYGALLSSLYNRPIEVWKR